MKKASKSKRPVSAESIARRAERGEDISEYFTNQGQMMPAIRKVDLDLTEPILGELDEVAKELNISRQAVTKAFVRQALITITWREKLGKPVSNWNILAHEMVSRLVSDRTTVRSCLIMHMTAWPQAKTCRAFHPK